MRLAVVALSGAIAAISASACAQTPVSYVRTVRVTLSPPAAARLAEMRERIVVSAFWSGQPKAGSEAPVNEDGTVTIGEERVTLPGTGGDARLTAESVDRALEAELDGGEALLNINVFSAREGGPDNVLHCDLYDGPASAAPEPIEIACKQIGE